MTIQNRVESAVTKIEEGSSVVTQYISGPAAEIFVGGKKIKSLSLVDFEVNEIKSLIQTKVFEINDQIDAELAKISQFEKSEWLPNASYSVRNIFSLDGLSYVPAQLPYNSSVDYQSDIDSGLLILLRGVARSDLGELAYQSSGYSKSTVIKNENVDFIFGSLSECNNVSRFIDDGQFVTLRSRFSKAECAVKGIEYPDQGGASYEFTRTAGLTGNFGSVLSVDTGYLRLLPMNNYHVSMWGVVDDMVDTSDQIQECHNYLKSIAVRSCRADGVKALCENIANFGNVEFDGGELRSRPDIMSGFASNVTPVFSDVNPENHLRSFSVADEPVVVLVGDSIATPFANALDYSSTLSGLLERKIRIENPLKKITFHNRAIGGQTWSTLASGPGFTAPYVIPEQVAFWYTDPNKNWLDYIEELKPDLIIFSFGMNDSKNINILHVRTILEQIKSWSGAPDVIISTNLVPQTDNTTYNFGEFEQQNGRDIAAGYQRSAAELGGYGFLDFNRACNFLLRGQDHSLSYSVETQIMNLDVNIVPTYMVDAWGCGYSVVAEVFADSNFYGAGRDSSLAFKLSEFKENSTGEFANYLLIWRDSDTGNLKFNVVNRIVDGTYFFSMSDIDTGVQAPTGNIRFSFECNGSAVSFYTVDMNGNRFDRKYIINHTVLSGGGWMQPEFGYIGSVVNRPDTWNNVSVYVRIPHRITPAITSNDAWGDAFQEGHTKSPIGGNGINHPTSKAASLIYGFVLDQVSFASRPILVGRYGRIGIGVSEPKATGVHVRQGISGVNQVSAMGHQLITEGENAVGNSLFLKDGGRASIVVSTPSNLEAAVFQFNDSAKEWRLYISGDLVSSFKATGYGGFAWEPGLISSGETKRQWFNLPGVNIGDVLDVSFDKMGVDIIPAESNYLKISAVVIGQNSVYVYLKNEHTSSVTLPAGTAFIRSRSIT